MFVTKGSKIGEVLKLNTGVSKILFETGMHCVGCPTSNRETLEEACAVHGIEVGQLVSKINAYLQQER